MMSALQISMSPHRQFSDDDGLVWQAWDVIPSWGERRIHQRRQRDLPPPEISGERRKAERRRHAGIRIGLTPQLARGWLAFESLGRRRRLVPVPSGWEDSSEEELRKMLASAEALPDRKGRLIE